MNKRIIKCILIIAFPLIIIVGTATWLISNYLSIKPEDATKKVITTYFDGLTTIYDGNIQLPSPRTFQDEDILSIDINDIEYYYKGIDDTNYTLCIKDEIGPQNAGSYQIRIRYKITDEDIREYDGLTFTIDQLELTEDNANINIIGSYIYNSLNIIPTFNVKAYYNNKEFDLTESDYSFDVSNNINASANALLSIEGKNNFKGIVTKKFTILPFQINGDNTVIQINGTYTYTSKTIIPNLTIVAHLTDTIDYELTMNEDYFTTGSNNVNAGTATYVVKGTNNFSNQLTGSFVINKANPVITTIPTYASIYEGELDNGAQPTFESGQATFNSSTITGTFQYDSIEQFTLREGIKYYYPKNGNSNASGFEAKVSYTFVSGNNNFNNLVVSTTENSQYLGNIIIKAIAYCGSTYYGSIEAALDANTSGTINVIASTEENRCIRSNCIVSSSVTLQFLYSASDIIMETKKDEIFYPKETIQGDRTSSLDNATTYRKNLVYLNDNVVLTNNGRINIGGVISSGNGGNGPNSQTCGNYAEIMLKQDAKVICNSGSYLVVYGAIREQNDSSLVLINDGAELYMPFVLIEHRGGTIFLAMNSDLQGTPFNRFYYENIRSSVRINNGGKFIAYGNLYARGGDNETLVNIVGNDSNYIVELLDNSYLLAKCSDDKINNIKTYGNWTLNYLTMKVSISSVSTEDVFFPISWYYNITLNKLDGQDKAIINCNQDLKLLPGAKVIVSPDVEVNAQSIIVYSEFNDVNVGCNNLYPKKEPAKLIVNGILNIKDGYSIGGLIENEIDGATININNNASTNVTSYEVIANSPLKWKGYTKTFQIYGYTLNGKSSIPLEGTNGIYYSLNQSWFSQNITFNYDSNGGTSIESKTISNISSNGYSIHTSDLSNIPTKDYYEFSGWYYDKNYTNKINEGDVLYCSITLYAKWNLVNYSINYVDVYKDDFTTGNTSSSSNDKTINFEEIKQLEEAINDSYVFGGWYTDKDCKNKILRLVGSDLVLLLNENSINVYALWYPEGTKKYIINYKNSHPEIDTCSNMDIIIAETEISWNTYWAGINKPDLSSKDSFDITYYFDGWLYNGSKIENLSDELFTYDDNQKAYVITLDANWIEKNKLTINITGYLTYDIYFKPGYQFTIPNWTDKNIKFKAGEVLVNWTIDDTVYETGDIVTLDNKNYIVSSNIYKYYKISIGTNSYTTVTITFTKDKGYLVSVDEDGVATLVSKFDNQTITNGEEKYIITNSEFKITYNGTKSDSKATISGGVTPNGTIDEGQKNSSDYTYTSTSGEIKITLDGSCIVEGTLITVADGTKKKVEDLTLNDELLVFNHETGQYSISKILFINNHNNSKLMQRVVNLEFSDGTILRIVEDHGLFDMDLLKYIYISEVNYKDYIGHRFYKGSYDESSYQASSAILTNAYITNEEVKIYAIITVGTMNCYTEGFLSMPTIPYNSEGLVNIFEYDSNLKYNEEKYKEDIEKYGLFTYEDFKDYMSYESYLASPAKYLKISMGKGLITYEEVIKIIEFLLSNNLID